MPATLSLESIAQDETPFCGSHHRWPDDIAGYVIVLTKFGEGRVRDLAIFTDSCRYGETVSLAKEFRAVLDREHYARIDVLYEDGCRGIL